MPQSNSNPLSVHNRHWGFSTAGRVFFGWGVLEELRNVRQELGERVLVCTDHNLVQAGIADRVDAWLKESGCAVHAFHDGRPEVDVATIEAATAAARAFEPDVIIGLGGGSNMDLAKCVAVLLTHGGPLQKYLRRERHPRSRRRPDRHPDDLWDGLGSEPSGSRGRPESSDEGRHRQPAHHSSMGAGRPFAHAVLSAACHGAFRHGRPEPCESNRSAPRSRTIGPHARFSSGRIPCPMPMRGRPFNWSRARCAGRSPIRATARLASRWRSPASLPGWRSRAPARPRSMRCSTRGRRNAYVPRAGQRRAHARGAQSDCQDSTARIGVHRANIQPRPRRSD